MCLLNSVWTRLNFMHSIVIQILSYSNELIREGNKERERERERERSNVFMYNVHVHVHACSLFTYSYCLRCTILMMKYLEQNEVA